MILVDTSVWIEAFRHGDSPEAKWIRAAVSRNDALCICGVILTEILQGIREERHYREVKRVLGRQIYLPTIRAAHVLAADIYREARARGKTIRGSVDCIIAACAIVNDVPLVQKDRDFEVIAGVSRLRVMPL